MSRVREEHCMIPGWVHAECVRTLYPELDALDISDARTQTFGDRLLYSEQDLESALAQKLAQARARARARAQASMPKRTPTLKLWVGRIMICLLLIWAVGGTCFLAWLAWSAAQPQH